MNKESQWYLVEELMKSDDGKYFSIDAFITKNPTKYQKNKDQYVVMKITVK